MAKRRRLFNKKQRQALDFAFENMNQGRLGEARYIRAWYSHDTTDRKELRTLVEEHLRLFSV